VFKPQVPDKYPLGIECVASRSVCVSGDYDICPYECTVCVSGDRDIGPYECSMVLANSITLTQLVNLYAYPQVRHMSRSRNLVAGKNLMLECLVWGWPVPRVTWHRLSSTGTRLPLNTTVERLHLRPGWSVMPPGIPVPNATLLISDVTYTDRDVYICDLHSQIGNLSRSNNATVLIRVKGKFAPLWPLLGILAEAAILCVIIVIHERNRAQQREEDARKEADNHTENSSSAQPSHDAVRHRKTT
jgi:hypothetical protein